MRFATSNLMIVDGGLASGVDGDVFRAKHVKNVFVEAALGN